MGIKDLASRGMSVEELFENLDRDTAVALREALRNMAFSIFEIAAACRDDGYEVRPRAIQEWRMKHMDELA